MSCVSDAPQVGSARSDSTRVVKVNRRKTNRRKTRPYCNSEVRNCCSTEITKQISSKETLVSFLHFFYIVAPLLVLPTHRRQKLYKANIAFTLLIKNTNRGSVSFILISKIQTATVRLQKPDHSAKPNENKILKLLREKF